MAVFLLEAEYLAYEEIRYGDPLSLGKGVGVALQTTEGTGVIVEVEVGFPMVSRIRYSSE
jgi:hypothetical protein